jgi:transcription initiation factor TFIID subunit TAF12
MMEEVKKERKSQEGDLSDNLMKIVPSLACMTEQYERDSDIEKKEDLVNLHFEQNWMQV